MTVNKGQSELLMNFVCSARSRGFDLKNLLLFPTDLFSKDLGYGLGLTSFYNEHVSEKLHIHITLFICTSIAQISPYQLMKLLPSTEAREYGDRTFGLMMIAKVFSVQLVNELGYDLLYQDVDVVWYKDPLVCYFMKVNFILTPSDSHSIIFPSIISIQ
jgi:hypothetical protein